MLTIEKNGKEYKVIVLMGKPLPCGATYFGSYNILGELWLGVDNNLYLQ